jgi:hypothetical protein
MLAGAAAWLDAAGVRHWAAGDAYPWINTLHLLGLVMLLGAIGVVDLRIAGAWRTLPVVALSRALTPVAVVGLAIMLPSGVLLFAADGRSLAGSGVFAAKLVLIGLALANAVAFRMLGSDRLEKPSMRARAMAVLSVGLWLTIGTLGRLIAYN